VDFCENDVLDAFEGWRRAVGVRLPGAEPPAEEAAERQRKRSLPEHFDRVCEKITNRRAGLDPLPADYDRVLEEVTNEVSIFKDLPSPIRGDVRQRVTTRLAELDRLMLEAARAHADATSLHQMQREAAEQLRPFRDRMPAESYDRALGAAVDSLLREREKLPIVSFA
jgi:hypothetical protein